MSIEESTRLNTGATGSGPCKLPKVIGKAEEVLNTGQLLLDCVLGVFSFVDVALKKLPKAIIMTVADASNLYSGALGVFTVGSLVSNIRRTVIAKDLVERVKSICKATLDIGSILSSASSILTGLKSIKVVAQNSLSWVSVVSVVLFPLQFLSLGLDFYEYNDTIRITEEALANIRKRTPLTKDRVKDITDACNYVIKNHERLSKALNISKKCKIDKKAQEILEALTSKQDKEPLFEQQLPAFEKGEALIRILRQRVKTKYNLERAGLVLKIIGVVSSGVALFTPPNPVTYGIAGAAGVASVIHFGLEKLLLNKDPFSPPRDVWYEKLAMKTRKFVYGTCGTIERIAQKAISSLDKGFGRLVDRIPIPIHIAVY